MDNFLVTLSYNKDDQCIHASTAMSEFVSVFKIFGSGKCGGLPEVNISEATSSISLSSSRLRI